MTIQEKIAAAWKETPRAGHYPMGRYSNTQMAGAEHHGFTAGYMAALRGLYCEPERLQEGHAYYARWAGQPMRKVYYDGQYLCYWETGGIGPNGEIEYLSIDISPEDCEVMEFVYPSPSEIFGEQLN